MSARRQVSQPIDRRRLADLFLVAPGAAVTRLRHAEEGHRQRVPNNAVRYDASIARGLR